MNSSDNIQSGSIPHFPILWEGNLTRLENRDGLLAVSIKRKVSIGQLSQHEKLELEETIGKMERVFLDAFGCGDFTRWMPLCDEEVVSYLIPASLAEDKDDEVNFEHLTRLMLFSFSGKKEYFASLQHEQIKKINKAAKKILSKPSQPLSLQEKTYKVIKVREAFSLLKDEILKLSSQFLLEWNKEWISNVSLSSICKVFCNPEIIKRQHIFETPVNHILSNPSPYTRHHLMIIPKRHITTLSASSKEEILDKYSCFARIDSIARNRFRCQKTAVITKIGRTSGQTQSHLHDHVVGYDPNELHPWMSNWAYEFCQQPNPLSSLNDEQLKVIKNNWEPFFKKIKAVAFDFGGVVVEQKNQEKDYLAKEFNLNSDQIKDLLAELKRVACGDIEENLFWKEMALKFKTNLKEDFLEGWKESYINSNPKNQPTIELIERLKNKQFQIPLLSNTIPSHAKINEESGLYKLFSPKLLSYEIKCTKPSHEAFSKLIEESKLLPQEMIFVDDVLENVMAANQAGMHGVLFQNVTQTEKEINQLTDHSI